MWREEPYPRDDAGLMSLLLNLGGKGGIVTGGGSGIGAETAELFAALGALVLVADLDEGKAQKVAERINSAGYRGRASCLKLDVTNLPSCTSCASTAFERHGGPQSFLFNSAGIVVPDGEGGTAPADLARMLDVNTVGTFNMISAVSPQMIAAGRGSIVNMGSVAGEVAIYRRSGYCISKAAVHALTESEALRLRASGIRVNAIAPGRVMTEMVINYLTRSATPAEDFRRSCSTQAGGVMALPAQIATIAAFLVSDMSSIMTGAVIDASDGWLAGHHPDMTSMPPAFEGFRKLVRDRTGLQI